jgi:RNA polymerase sigma factor (sigma-70 family)
MVTQFEHASSTVVHSLTPDNVNELLATLQPEIERQARALYYRVFSVSVDIQDLTQEGMIGAWTAAEKYDASKIKDARSFRGYCLKRARGAMLNYLRQLFDRPAISLEDWQEVDTGDSTRYREIEDRPAPARKTSRAMRRRMLAAMRLLTEKERAVVMSAYMIDDNRGRCSTPGDIRARLQLTESAYYHARKSALKHLATAL